MKTGRALAFVAASILFIAAYSTSASAGLIHNLTTDFGSGQITFKDSVGSSGSLVSDVEEFFFDVSSGFPGGPQSYSTIDISSISWSIAADSTLTLTLVSDLKPFDDHESAITLVNSGIFAPIPCLTGTSTSDSTSCELHTLGSTITVFSALTTEAVPEAPEPTSLVLFLAGLLGLVMTSRRRHSV